MFKRDRTGRAGRVPKLCSGCDSYILVAIEGEKRRARIQNRHPQTIHSCSEVDIDRSVKMHPGSASSSEHGYPVCISYRQLSYDVLDEINCCTSVILPARPRCLDTSIIPAMRTTFSVRDRMHHTRQASDVIRTV